MSALIERDGVRLLLADKDGPLLSKPQDAADLAGEAFSLEVSTIAVPAARLDPAFFTLRNGLAGEFIQKIINYRMRLAVVGDIEAHLQRSEALRAFVIESNRGRDVFFLPDLEVAVERLAGLS